jgi:hypothetical protein
MKTTRKTIGYLYTATLAFGLVLNFSGCSKESPLQPQNDEKVILNETMLMAKPAAGAYPQYAERKFNWHKINGYAGGNLNVNGGSTFHLEMGALTPPEGTAIGDPVTLTMLVERDKFRTELVFTFGPHGCQFDPPAEVIFDWQDLHSNNATLYYIDKDGNYIPQTPDNMDVQNKKMTLYIEHFSRYAIGSE